MDRKLQPNRASKFFDHLTAFKYAKRIKPELSINISEIKLAIKCLTDPTAEKTSDSIKLRPEEAEAISLLLIIMPNLESVGIQVNSISDLGKKANCKNLNTNLKRGVDKIQRIARFGEGGNITNEEIEHAKMIQKILYDPNSTADYSGI